VQEDSVGRGICGCVWQGATGRCLSKLLYVCVEDWFQLTGGVSSSQQSSEHLGKVFLLGVGTASKS